MAWFPSYQSLARHPKTHRLMARLKTSRAETVGHLNLFWWWCLDYAPDGSITGFSAEEVAIAMEWDGDADALLDGLIFAGFIDATDAGLVVHDWDEYGGKIERRKAAHRDRMRESRAADVPGGDDPQEPRDAHVQRTDDARDAHVRTQRREEEKREEERTDTGADAPEPAPGDEPKDDPAIKDTAKTTKTRKAPLTFCPETFPLEDKHYEYGAKKGLTRAELERETEKFLNWHGSKQTQYGDWYKTWQNWIIGALEDKEKVTPFPQQAPQSPEDARLERTRKRIAYLERGEWEGVADREQFKGEIGERERQRQLTFFRNQLAELERKAGAA